MSTILENSYISFVNLDHRTDRLERMRHSTAKAGLWGSVERTRGLLPSEVKVDPKRVAVMQARTPGAIGCHFAQVSIMERALSLGRHAFVMEDDLIFCSDFQERMVLFDAFAEKHPWDIFWLGGTFHINPPYWHKKRGRDAELTNNPHFLRTYGAFCTYAYIVNQFSVQKVLNLLDRELDRSIGIDYAMIQIQPELYTYAFVPGCITQYDNQSDIGKGKTIFSGFSKLGPYWFQDRMESFDPSSYNWHEAKVR